MGTIFGIFLIIMGIVLVVASFTPKGPSNVSPIINFILGLIFAWFGSSLIG